MHKYANVSFSPEKRLIQVNYFAAHMCFSLCRDFSNASDVWESSHLCILSVRCEVNTSHAK